MKIFVVCINKCVSHRALKNKKKSHFKNILIIGSLKMFHIKPFAADFSSIIFIIIIIIYTYLQIERGGGRKRRLIIQFLK